MQETPPTGPTGLYDEGWLARNRPQKPETLKKSTNKRQCKLEDVKTKTRDSLKTNNCERSVCFEGFFGEHFQRPNARSLNQSRQMQNPSRLRRIFLVLLQVILVFGLTFIFFFLRVMFFTLFSRNYSEASSREIRQKLL